MNSKAKTASAPKTANKSKRTPPAPQTLATEVDLQKELKECRAEVICLRAKFNPAEVEKYKIQTVTTEQMFQDALYNAERDLKRYAEGASDNPMVKELKDKVYNRDKENTALRKAAKHDAEEITVLKRRCDSLELENTKIKKQYDSVVNKLPSTNDLKHDADTLQKELDEVKKDRDSIRRQLAGLKKTLGSTEKELSDYMQERVILKDTATKNKTEIDDLRSTNDILNKTIAQLKTDLSTAQTNDDKGLSNTRMKLSQLEQELKSTEEESARLRKIVHTLEQELKDAREESQTMLEAKTKLESEMKSVSAEREHLSQEVARQSELLHEKDVNIDQLQNKLAESGESGVYRSVDGRISESDRDNELKRLQSECKELETKLKEEKEAHNRTKQEKDKLEMRCHDAFEKISQKEKKLAQQEANHKQLIERKDSTIKELRREKTIVDPNGNSKPDLKTLEINNKKLFDELEDLKRENKDMRMRLSKASSSQLLDGNADIADLSDLCRPEVLVEKFSQLYDNEWTDALETCEIESKSTKDAVERLLKALEDAYSFCKEQSKLLSKRVLASFHVAEKSKNRAELSLLSPKKLQTLEDLVKHFAADLGEQVIEEYMKRYKPFLAKKNICDRYVQRCVSVCWLMCIQNPTIVLDTGRPSGTFNDTLYRHFTKGGNVIDYVVWPPVRIQDNGRLICKGIAQGK